MYVHIGIMRYTRAQWVQVKGSAPPLLYFASSQKKKTPTGQGIITILAHEHVHAHRHNDIHKGTVGAGKVLDPTPIVLSFIAKK